MMLFFKTNNPLFSGVRLIPMLVVMGAIFFLSHQPGALLNVPDISNIDKVGHFMIYGLLAFTVTWAPVEEVKKQRPGLIIVFSILFCLVYGVSDEFHQSFIPGRSASVGDLVADFFGIIFFCAIWARKYLLVK